MKTRSRTVRFAGALLATNLKASLARRGAFAMQAALMAINNFTFFAFWWLLMRRVPVIRGWALPDVEVLMGIVAAAFGLGEIAAGGVRRLGHLIDEGELDTLLVQPQPVLLHACGLRSQASGFGDILSGLILLAWSGRVFGRNVPLLFAAVVASAVVFVCSGTVFFSLAFWLGRVRTLARQVWELTLTFSLYPEPLFGGALRLVLFTLLPAAWVGYVPVHVVEGASPGWLLALVAFACAYAAFAAFVFDRGLRRYASGSRFAAFG
jgi:viologen exporter family transport system permease protein